MLPKVKVSEVIVIDGDGESASGAVPQYRIDDLNELRKAEQIAVGKICDLDRASGHGLSPLLRAWTVIIKEGKRVRELSSKQKTISKFAAQKTKHCSLQFSEAFIAKHSKLVSLATEGNWITQIGPGSAVKGKRAVHEIHCLEDYRRFLIQQRRCEAGAKSLGSVTCDRLLGYA